MSVIVPFPGGRAASHRGQHNRAGQTLGAVHRTDAGLISWVRSASCDCCGRQTLARRGGTNRATLCGQCRPLGVA
jgi:hypothetical protein